MGGWAGANAAYDVTPRVARHSAMLTCGCLHGNCKANGSEYVAQTRAAIINSSIKNWYTDDGQHIQHEMV